MDRRETELPPHVLVFPHPAQGHVTSMLRLAELLCHAGLHVTFLVTHHTHRCLLRHSNAQSRFERDSGFRFETISDGLPEDHPRSTLKDATTVFFSFRVAAKRLIRDLLISDREKSSDTGRKPITCIIADGMSNFTIDVAEEIGIPIFSFRTSSGCNFWAIFCEPKLIEAGEFPFKGNNLDVPMESVPGMEGFLRRRDLPSCYRAGDPDDHGLQMLLSETLKTTRARGLILNTFEELEGPVLREIRTQCPNIYAIGPLHAHLKMRQGSPISSNSLWEEDRSCMAWLNAQPSRSVIYVSFGSTTMMTKDQVVEFWHGLINSGKQFLWVIRPDSVADRDGESQIPTELLEGTKERGYMVGWAPQEEVLAHNSIGGFLTHSGWNSTLESIVAGVPMICWPFFGDQPTNSRFVEEVWNLGLDMKDTCDRVVIEKMVRDLMDVRKEEFLQSADRMAKLANEAISEGGTSFSNLDCLIRDIKAMSADY